MASLPSLESLAVYSNSYASAHGIQVERRHPPDNKGPPASYFETAPMSLLPNAFPLAAFEQAQSLAPAFNELVDRVSRDDKFLQESLGGGVADTDPFTKKLLDLYNQIYVNNPGNVAHTADRLGIHRSDYMLHPTTTTDDDNEKTEYKLKQIELNTIAASFAGLSVRVSNLHRHLVSRFPNDVSEFLQHNAKIVSNSSDPPRGVPENPALSKIPKAMQVAFQRYADRFKSGKSNDLIILFVVQDGETNTVDQRLLEFQLWDEYQIPVVRKSLTTLSKELTTSSDDGILTLDGKEIALVYFRAGYAPTDYPDGIDGCEWTARATLEQSRCAKCPSLGYHLAGTKKVQQELARPGVLERFFSKENETPMIEEMRLAFAGLYSTGEDATPEDIAAVQDALSGQAGNYVLKPQREGGGYNFYGEKLAKKLRENTSKLENDNGTLQLGSVLAEYILMERLFPPQQRAILLRGGRVEGSGESVSELGCYGTLVVSPNGQVEHNEYAGFLLRTKFSNVDEGGVASGFATLSSPYLC